jgi:hypothetical protein
MTRPIAHCAVDSWIEGKTEAQDAFSNVPFEGSSPVYIEPSAHPDTKRFDFLVESINAGSNANKQQKRLEQLIIDGDKRFYSPEEIRGFIDEAMK